MLNFMKNGSEAKFKGTKRLAGLLAGLLLLLGVLGGCGQEAPSKAGNSLPEQGSYYYDLENVVLYLDAYGELPPNYITKAEARKLGWQGGPVDRWQEGAAIGGDSFGNREGLLPEGSYTECDLNTLGADNRGAERLVFADPGGEDSLYYYTGDHYESFCRVVIEDGQVMLAEEDCGGDA